MIQRWIRSSSRAIGLRSTLALMLALFVAIICVRAILTRAQGVAITTLYESFAQHLRQRLSGPTSEVIYFPAFNSSGRLSRLRD